jgi:type I restriction enzyme S subunit
LKSNDLITPNWLSNMKSSWRIIPFKYLFALSDDTNEVENPRVLSLTQNGIVERDISNNEGQIAASYEKSAVARIGDFVLNPMDLRAGSVAISPLDGTVSNAYYVFRPNGKFLVDPGYYEQYFKWHYFSDIFYSYGNGVGRPEGSGGRWTLQRETLMNFPILYPPIEDQVAISGFLTSKITAARELVKQKQLVVESIESLLRAEIHKDLNSTSIQYEKHQLRYLLQGMKTGGTPDEELQSSVGLPWYTPASIDSHGTLGDPVRILPIDLNDQLYSEFDSPSVLIVGIGATAGKVAYLDHRASSNQQITCLIPNERILAKYLYYFLYAHRENLLAMANYTTLPILNNEFLKTVDISLPSIENQLALVEKWEAKRHKFESAILNINESVRILKSYSDALIAHGLLGYSRKDGSYA